MEKVAKGVYIYFTSGVSLDKKLIIPLVLGPAGDEEDEEEDDDELEGGTKRSAEDDEDDEEVRR